MELSRRSKPVPDCVAPGIRVLFVGINPGQRSGETGHHFAGRSNRFWRLLHEAGLTPELLRPEDDVRLPAYGLGVTNLVDRPTQGEHQLSWEEMCAGARRVRRLVEELKPAVVCVLGKRAYRAYAGLPPSAPVEWGLQPRATVPGTRDFVAPNPSGRNPIPFSEQLRWMKQVASLAAQAAAGAPEPWTPQPPPAPGGNGYGFRLVVCDIEGCIVPGGGRPWPLPDMARLADLVARGERGEGPRLVLCSGRPAQFVDAVAQALGARLPAVCENGAVIFYPDRGLTRPLYTRAQARLMERVRRFCLKRYQQTGLARVPGGRELGVSLLPEPDRWNDLGDLLADVRERLEREAGVAPEALHVVASGSAVDITPAGIHKGVGVQQVLAELGVPPRQVFAIGDGGNDLPVLTMAGASGAPANARAEVRAAVTRVASQPYTAGVVELWEAVLHSQP